MRFDKLNYHLTQIANESSDNRAFKDLIDLAWYVRKHGIGGLTQEPEKFNRDRVQYDDLINSLAEIAQRTSDNIMKQKLIWLRESLIKNGIDGYVKLPDGTVVVRSAVEEEILNQETYTIKDLLAKTEKNSVFYIPGTDFEISISSKESLKDLKEFKRCIPSESKILCIFDQYTFKDYLIISEGELLWIENWFGKDLHLFKGNIEEDISITFRERNFQIVPDIKKLKTIEIEKLEVREMDL